MFCRRRQACVPPKLGRRAAQYARKEESLIVFPALMRVDWSEKVMLDEARQAAAREFELLGHIRDR
jgi:hypothetical protein